MINNFYLQDVIKAYKVKQADLAKKWELFSGKGKQQSSLSRLLNSQASIDSISFVKALSGLTDISLLDLIEEAVPPASRLEKYLKDKRKRFGEDKKILELEEALAKLQKEIDDLKK